MEETDKLTVFDQMLLEKSLPLPVRCFLRLANTLYKRNRTKMDEEDAYAVTLITSCIAIGFVAGGGLSAPPLESCCARRFLNDKRISSPRRVAGVRRAPVSETCPARVLR